MKLITLVSGALLAASFALWIAPTSAFAQRNRSGLTPPPPPPYDTTQLGKWAEVGPAKLAACLALAAQGDVAGAAKNVETLIESADADLKVRLQSELDRLIGLEEARDAWVNQLRMDKAYLRLPVEGKMAAFKVDRIEEGKIHFTKGRKGVDFWAMSELSPALMVENLGRKLNKIEPLWLAAYLPALAQVEWDPAKLESLDKDLMKELQQYGWMLKLGTVSQEITALAQAGYPEGEAEQLAMIARLGAVNEARQTIPALEDMHDDLRAYAQELAKRAYAQVGLDKLLNGVATDLGEGRWKIVYEFDKVEEAKDFANVPDLFEYCMPAAIKTADAANSGWVHNESALAWAGRVGMLHHVPMVGAMSAKYDWQASRIGETFDIQGGNLVFGMAANPGDLSFVGQAFIHSIWCYQKGQLINASNGPVPMYEKRTYKCVLNRDAEGEVSGSMNGKETGKASAPKADTGPFFLAANLNIRGRLERLELEGTPAPGGLEGLRKTRAHEHLVPLGLE